MSQDEFTKLFKYMEKRFNDIEKRMSKHDAQFDQVMGALDTILKNQETDQQERLAANHQLDRHEHWITQAAPKLGVRYDTAA